MLRSVIFLLGILLMALSLFFPLFTVPAPARFDRGWLFDLGLVLAIGAHGWPENLR